MSRRSILILPAVLTAVSLPVVPAFAGEDDGSGPAKLHTSTHACVAGHRVKAAVTGSDIDTVEFFVDGRRMKTVTRPAATGRWVFSMRCSRVSVGAHRARAVVSFTEEESAPQTLRFQITRVRQAAPRFTG